ncbi:MAG: hypothetical protein ABSH48_12620 [Verrucomicrobiota bacterium]
MVSNIVEDPIKFIAEIAILTIATFVVISLLGVPFVAPYFKGRLMGSHGWTQDDPQVQNRMIFVYVIKRFFIFTMAQNEADRTERDNLV